MKNLHILFIILTCLNVGCTYNNNTNILEIFKDETEATTRLLNIDSDDIAQPIVTLFSIDKYIGIQSIMNKKHIYLYDVKSEKYTHSLYNVGRGHNEVFDISSVQPIQNQLFLFYNYNKTSLKPFALYDNNDGGMNGLEMPQSENQYLKLAHMGNNLYVATGLFPNSDKQFALLDESFEIIEYYDDFPSNYKSSFSPQALSFGLQGSITTSGNNYMYSSTFGSIFKFYTVDNYKISKHKEYYYDTPKFESTSDKNYSSATQDRHNIVGELCVTASKECYYILYSDKTIEDKDRTSSKILTFDMDGNPIEVINLDRHLEFITYSESLKSLYGIGLENNMPKIYEIK